jgi:hypothetical protein
MVLVAGFVSITCRVQVKGLRFRVVGSGCLVQSAVFKV